MIDVKDLTFTYAGTQTPAIEGLDFQIQQGQIFGFLGPSGAGKSTTQKILIGLLEGFSGQARVFGQHIAAMGSDYYVRIGVSFEVPNLYSKLSGVENLVYFGSLYAGETKNIPALLEQVGLSEDDGRMLVSQYSKGMRNRLNVARSMLHDPELLFLDEPTAGLDPVNARRIKDLIREQKAGGKTIFLTTHDMYVADQLCDEVAFIVDGRISTIAPPQSLKLEHGLRSVRVEFTQNGSTSEADFSLEDLGSNRDFIRLLQESHVHTIHTQEATLEDIFIKVTGRALS